MAKARLTPEKVTLCIVVWYKLVSFDDTVNSV